VKTMTYELGVTALPFHASTFGTIQGIALPGGKFRSQGLSRPVGGGALLRLRGRAGAPTPAPDSVVRGSVI
jgi:hypothetical protein